MATSASTRASCDDLRADHQTADAILADIDDSANAQHYIGGGTFGLYQRSRITARCARSRAT